MKTLKIYFVAISACIFFLALSSTVSAQTQYNCYYQYYEYNQGETWTGDFEFGDDPIYCPEYHIRPNQSVYLEPRSFIPGYAGAGGSGYFSLYSGSPDSYFNYGGFGMLTMSQGQYALLKAEFYTPTGTVVKYIYLSCF